MGKVSLGEGGGSNLKCKAVYRIDMTRILDEQQQNNKHFSIEKRALAAARFLGGCFFGLLIVAADERIWCFLLLLGEKKSLLVNKFELPPILNNNFYWLMKSLFGMII